jgi:outer membrane receptor protein involved in Fe transport
MTKANGPARTSRLLLAASALALAASWTTAASAQPAGGVAVSPADAPPQTAAGQAAASRTDPDVGALGPDTSAAAEANEIVVTGSRLATSGFNAPTPTTVVNAGEIARRAPTNIADALNELPAFRATTAPTVNTFSGSSVGQSFADLRGLGSTRTLVLVNGRRHVPTSPTGQVDLSLIPTQLIERSEVVTGGASAAWGSDAVAGVVNLILRNKLEGIEGTAQRGITERGDDENYKLGLVAGTAFAGSRGHIIIGGEATDSRGIRNIERREWTRGNGGASGFIGNANWQTNGLPATIYSYDIQYSNQTRGGIITGVPNTPAAQALRGITFLDNGQLGRLQMGQVFGGLMIGGGQPGLNNYTNFFLKVPVRRLNGLTHVEYEFSDSVRAFAELSYAKSTTSYVTVVPRDAGSATAPTVAPTAPIPRGSVIARVENPFMPADLRRLLQQAGVVQVAVGRYNEDIGYTNIHISNQTARAVGGFEGDLGGGWSWDAYYQYGKNRTEFDSQGGRRIEARWVQAIDVVTNPANGQPICRSTLTAPGNGCVPFNIFGPNASSQAARDYVVASTFLNTNFTQQVAAANIRGDLFDLFAGPVSVAGGVEWRRDRLSQKADPISSTGNQLQFGNVTPTSGSVSVKEAYAEAAIRLARDQPFAKSIDLNFAGRITDYSTSGKVTTWKAGATWDMNDAIRVRGTVSRDIRAPNVAELFTAASTTPFIPAQNGGTAAVQLTGGNPNLEPEKAYTYTAGLVLQPSFLQGFRASVDWYRISVSGQIAAVAAATIVNRCDQGAAVFCGLITRDPTTRLITEVASQNQNLVGFKTSGLDFEVSYARPLSAVFGDGAPGDFSIRGLSTYVYQLATDDGFSVIERAGSQAGGGVPKWLHNLSLTYSLDRFSGTVQTRIVAGNKLDALAIPGTSTSANIYRVPGAAYVNLSLSYDLLERSSGHQVQLFGVVDNLFDKVPPFPVVQNAFYDIIGRAFKVGVRFRY